MDKAKYRNINKMDKGNHKIIQRTSQKKSIYARFHRTKHKAHSWDQNPYLKIVYYRPMVLKKTKYIINPYCYTELTPQIPNLEIHHTSNLSRSLLDPFDYFDSYHFNKSHLNDQLPILTDPNQKKATYQIILSTFMKKEKITTIYHNIDTPWPIEGITMVNWKQNATGFNEVVFLTNNNYLNFHPRKNPHLILEFKIVDISSKFNQIHYLVAKYRKAYFEIAPNNMTRLFLVLSGNESPSDNSVSMFQLKQIVAGIINNINSVIQKRNKFNVEWDDASEEYVSMMNLNYVYSIAKKYHLKINQNYLNQYGDLKEIKFKSAKFISQYFPEEFGIATEKLEMTNIGLYSVSKPYESQSIINIITKKIDKILQTSSYDLVVTDGTGGVGGDAIEFSRYFKFINIVEIMPLHADIIRNNMDVYGRTNYKVFNENYVSVYPKLVQDIIYLDFPWGGLCYRNNNISQLTIFDSDVTFESFCHQIHQRFPQNIIFIKCPIQFNVIELKKDLQCRMETNPVSTFQLVTIFWE